MPIRIPVTGIITYEELQVIMRANAIELRERQREQADAIHKYHLAMSDIDKK